MMLRSVLLVYGIIHALIMLGVTVWASLDDSILNQGPLLDIPWFWATLTDTYLAFVLVYLWFALTTKGVFIKILYFISFMCLGNIAMGLAITYRALKYDNKMTLIDFIKGDLHD